MKPSLFDEYYQIVKWEFYAEKNIKNVIFSIRGFFESARHVLANNSGCDKYFSMIFRGYRRKFRKSL